MGVLLKDQRNDVVVHYIVKLKYLLNFAIKPPVICSTKIFVDIIILLRTEFDKCLPTKGDTNTNSSFVA